jgi:hypothetical protein
VNILVLTPLIILSGGVWRSVAFSSRAGIVEHSDISAAGRMDFVKACYCRVFSVYPRMRRMRKNPPLPSGTGFTGKTLPVKGVVGIMRDIFMKSTRDGSRGGETAGIRRQTAAIFLLPSAICCLPSKGNYQCCLIFSFLTGLCSREGETAGIRRQMAAIFLLPSAICGLPSNRKVLILLLFSALQKYSTINARKEK